MSDGYLQALVDKAGHDLLKRKPEEGGLLFLGNPHLAFPSLLFEDPLLEPVDRNVWVAIKMAGADGGVVGMPTYNELMVRCNVSSSSTIARSLAVLRATRWLTIVVPKKRDAHGMIRGSVSALHDEPLQVADTLELDRDYLTWLRTDAVKHSHARVRKIAGLLLEGMERTRVDGVDVTERGNIPLQRHQQLADARAVNAGRLRLLQKEDGVDIEGVSGNYLGISSERLVLKKEEMPASNIEVGGGKTGENDHLRISKTVEKPDKTHLRISKMEEKPIFDIRSKPESELGQGSSNIEDRSSSLYITTTTRQTSIFEVGWLVALGVATTDAELLVILANGFPVETQQAVAGCLRERLRTVKAGQGRPVRNLLAFVQTLFKRAAVGVGFGEGQLNPSASVVGASPAGEPVVVDVERSARVAEWREVGEKIRGVLRQKELLGDRFPVETQALLARWEQQRSALEGLLRGDGVPDKRVAA